MEQVNKSWIEQRGAVYQYRRLVPESLQAAIGKKEIRHSLRTRDKEEAHRRQHLEDVALDAEWERLRRGAVVSELTDEQRRQYAAEWLRRSLEEDLDLRAQGQLATAWRNHDPTMAPDEQMDELVEDQLAGVRRAVAEGTADEYGIAAEAARDVIRRHGLTIPEASSEFRALRFTLLRAAIEYFETLKRRNRGDLGPFIVHPAPAPSTPSQPAPPSAVFRGSLDDLFKHWASRQDRPKTVSEGRKTLDDFRKANNLTDMAPTAVTKDHVRRLRDYLEQQGCARATAKKKLGLLSGMFTRAEADGLFEVTSNPVNRIEPRGRREEPRRHWTATQLNALFASPLYSAAPPAPFGNLGREVAYWLPLLGLFTGARLGEICQLRVEDVQEEAGIPFILFTDEGEDQRLKTGAMGRHRVPVSPRLRELGFLEFVADARARRQVQLFPTLRADRRGGWSAAASKWFKRVRDRVFQGSEGGRDFHSFRHAFKYYMRASGVSEEQHDVLTAHRGRRTVGGGYGRADGDALGPLAKAIETYRIEGLQLPDPYRR